MFRNTISHPKGVHWTYLPRPRFGSLGGHKLLRVGSGVLVEMGGVLPRVTLYSAALGLTPAQTGVINPIGNPRPRGADMCGLLRQPCRF